MMPSALAPLLDAGSPPASSSCGAPAAADDSGFGQMLSGLLPGAVAAPDAPAATVTTTAAALSVLPATDAGDSLAAIVQALTGVAPQAAALLTDALPGTPEGVTDSAEDPADPRDTTGDDGLADWLAALPAGLLPLPAAQAMAGMPAAGNAGALASAIAGTFAGASAPTGAASSERRGAMAGWVGARPLMTEPNASALPVREAAAGMPALAALTGLAVALSARAQEQSGMPAFAQVLSPGLSLGQSLTAADTLRTLPGLEAVTGSDILPAGTLFVQPSAGAVRDALQISLPQHALNDAGWADAFSQRLVMLARDGIQSASLQLNPVDLGPIQVKLEVSDQAARIEFSARRADTGDLIESALPRLVAALDAQGIRLDDVKISQLPARVEAVGLAAQNAGLHSGHGQGSGQGSAQSQSQSQQAGGERSPDGQGGQRGNTARGDHSESGQQLSGQIGSAGGIDYYA